MATATQTLRMDNNNPIKTSASELPRIDLAKLDNIPYYIESTLLAPIDEALCKIN